MDWIIALIDRSICILVIYSHSKTSKMCSRCQKFHGCHGFRPITQGRYSAHPHSARMLAAKYRHRFHFLRTSLSPSRLHNCSPSFLASCLYHHCGLGTVAVHNNPSALKAIFSSNIYSRLYETALVGRRDICRASFRRAHRKSPNRPKSVQISVPCHAVKRSEKGHSRDSHIDQVNYRIATNEFSNA